MLKPEFVTALVPSIPPSIPPYLDADPWPDLTMEGSLLTVRVNHSIFRGALHKQEQKVSIVIKITLVLARDHMSFWELQFQCEGKSPSKKQRGNCFQSLGLTQATSVTQHILDTEPALRPWSGKGVGVE